MTNETFISAGVTHKVTVYPAKPDGKKYPVILLLHGNAGLVEPYGDQIRGFAKNLAALGYLTAVPQYYANDNSHLTDTTPHDQILADAIVTLLTKFKDGDPDRIGLIGFSLGAATAMTYIASNSPGKVKALADFFGFLTPTIEAGIKKFPPTIIFHNEKDRIVPFIDNSKKLDKLLTTSSMVHDLVTYNKIWDEYNHAFPSGSLADVDSQAKATSWFVTYLPPVGI